MKIEIVSEKNFEKLFSSFSFPYAGFDTETFGREFGDELFSLAIYANDVGYYLNYYTGIDHEGNFSEVILPKYFMKNALQEIFSKGEWFSHNAKFDMQKIKYTLGICIEADVHCTMINERIIRNDKLDYSLERVAWQYGMEKNKEVDSYLKGHGLYKKRIFMGDVMDKSPEFYKVPFKILTKYACMDAKLHHDIGLKQLEIIRNS